MDKNFSFETIGSAARRTQRPVNPARIPSDVSFELEKSEGVRPSVAFMPHKYHPTVKKIHTVSNEDFGIAIPKGTIVSAVPVVSEGAYKAGFSVSGTAIADTTSGQLAVGIDNDSNVLYAGAEDPLYGYGKVLNAAVVANGGAIAQDAYHTYDYTDTERVKGDGTLITVSDRFTRAANIPLGIAHEDIYINREGQYLNASESSFMLFDSVLSDWLIAVPYVVSGGNYTVTCTANGAGVQTRSAAYTAMHGQGIACMVAPNKESVFALGNLVKSDLNGKFVPQASTAAAALTATPNAQTVGRIFAVDTKFPKDIEDTVQNYPLGHSGGTATYGLPLDLYRLVYYILTGSSIAVTYDNILTALNSGEMGIVWINLHVN